MHKPRNRFIERLECAYPNPGYTGSPVCRNDKCGKPLLKRSKGANGNSNTTKYGMSGSLMDSGQLMKSRNNRVGNNPTRNSDLISR